MLNRWDPFSEMSRLQDMFRATETGRTGGFRPAVDIYEDKEAILVHAELPGVKREDVHIDVENHVLTIRGERKLEREDKRDGYHRVERSFGSFTRSFTVPDTVDAESIQAEMKDGVLKVTLPKRAAVKPRRIEVKA